MQPSGEIVRFHRARNVDKVAFSDFEVLPSAEIVRVCLAECWLSFLESPPVPKEIERGTDFSCFLRVQILSSNSFWDPSPFKFLGTL